MSTETAPSVDGATELPLRPDIFLSYSRSDEQFVRRLVVALEARGKDVWVDLSDIRKGADWHAKMLAGVESARVVVPVLSPAFTCSESCAQEIGHAVAHNKRLVPIVRHSVDRGSLRAELTAPNWIFFEDEGGFETAVAELVEAADADLDWLDEHARLLARALEWKRAEERVKPSLLLRGRDLRAAEGWLAEQDEHREHATPAQIDYIVASRRSATRRQQVTIGAVVLALAVAIALAIFALIQRSDAIRAETLATSRQLAAVSENSLSTNLRIALLLAAKGFHTDANPQTRSALLKADLYSPRLSRFLPMGAAVTSLAGSDDRSVVAAGLADGSVMRWELGQPAPQRLATLKGAVKNVAVSGDGEVVVAVDGSTGVVWRSGRAASAIACAGSQQPDATAVSPSGRTVVVHCRANTFEGPQSILVSAAASTAVHPLRPTGIEPTIVVVPSDSELFMLDGSYGRWERRHLPDWRLELASSAEFGVHQYLPGYSSGGGSFTVSNGGESIPVWPTDRPTAAFNPPLAAQAPISSPTALALSPDGRRLAVADSGTIYIAPVQAAKASYSSPSELVGNGSINADALRFFGDSFHLLSASGNAIALWDLTQFDRLTRAESTSLVSPCNGCGGAWASVSPDGRKVAAVADAGDYALVQGLDARARPEIVGPTAFGPPLWRDGKVLLPAAGRPPSHLPAGIEGWQATGSGDRIVASALSADGRSATIVDERGYVFVEDPSTGKVEQHVAGPPDLVHAELQLYAGEAAIDPDERLVAIVDKGSARITDLRSDRVTRVPGSDAAYAAFAAGRLLVQRESGALEVWDARGTARQRSAAGDRSYAGFSPVPDPRGDLVARQRSDGTITIVDLTSGATLGTISAPAPPSLGLRLGLAFSADGDTLVTIVQAVGSQGSLILVHSVGDPALLDAGCSAGGPGLTKDEWRAFVGSNPPGDLRCN